MVCLLRELAVTSLLTKNVWLFHFPNGSIIIDEYHKTKYCNICSVGIWPRHSLQSFYSLERLWFVMLTYLAVSTEVSVWTVLKDSAQLWLRV